MSDPFPLFPGFKVPPTDPSREVKRKFVTIEPHPHPQDDDDLSCEDEYCDRCANTGAIDCFCGGDLCVCRNNGEMPCPECGGY